MLIQVSLVLVSWSQVMLLSTSFFPHRELSTIWKSFMVMPHQYSCLLKINHRFAIEAFGMLINVKNSGWKTVMASFEKTNNCCHFWFVYRSMGWSIQCVYQHKTLGFLLAGLGVEDHSMVEGIGAIFVHSEVFFLNMYIKVVIAPRKL